MVAITAVAAIRCETPDEGTAGLKACTHVDSANKALDTFLKNHPIEGTVAPPSQAGVLSDVINELIAAHSEAAPSQLLETIAQAIDDATQMHADLVNGKPVRNGLLISDFDNLASLCGQLRSSDIVAPPVVAR